MRLTFIHLLIIVILSLFLRTIFLDRVPTGITEDELDYVLNAKAIAVSNKDISQIWNPFSLTTPPYETPKAEIPYLLIAPFFLINPNLSLLNVRIPYVLFSVLFVILMYFIGREITNKNIAFVIGLVVSINPWSIYFGRTSYDVPLAVYFYFAAFYALLIFKKYKILLALPFFIIAFFSYIGTKIIYVPFVSTTIFYSWLKNKKKYSKQFIALFVLCLIPFIYFLFSLKTLPVASRTVDLVSLNSPAIANRVNVERRATIQSPFSKLFTNKAIVFGKELINDYLEVFSTNFLFLYGENTPFISLWYHGIFYYIDIIFLLIGAYYLLKTSREAWYVLVAILLIGPLPSITSTVGKSYSIRASLSFPIFMIFIGCGIWSVLNLKKTKTYRLIATLIIITVYLFLISNFMNLYLFRHPIYNSEASGLSGRIIAHYITLAAKEDQTVVFLDYKTNPYLFKEYIFYTNDYSKQTAPLIAKAIRAGNNNYRNLRTEECPDKIFNNMVVIGKPDTRCKTVLGIKNYLSIPALSSGGEIYRIYNDKICSRYKLSLYPFNFSINDFAIEKLSTERFCTKFITSLTSL